MTTRLLLFSAILFLHLQIWGQTSSARDAVSFKHVWVDHYSPKNNWLNGDFADYDLLTTGAEIGYTRWLSESWNLHLPLRLATADLSNSIPPGESGTTWMNLDGVLQWKLLDNTHRINPYFTAGIGAVYTDWKDLEAQIPFGAGVHVRLVPGIFLTSQVEYRYALGDRKSDNMQFLAGLMFPIGAQPQAPTDTDRDGIPDTLDECPLQAGSELMNGCPDGDGDGLSDMDDECPGEAGPKELKGCPDKDGDGIVDGKDACPDRHGPFHHQGCPDSDGDDIPDKEDKCPDQAGSAVTDGCPDSDGDGIVDAEDRCPDQRGPAHLSGCPDKDNDGIPDNEDKCPDQAGMKANMGCPELKEEEKAIVATAIRDVQFVSGSAELTQTSHAILDQLVEVLRNNPAYHCDIHGHTDATGDNASNLDLSNRRAKACLDEIVSKGIAANRLSAAGFGDTRPVGDNKTIEGRKANRRVEFLLIVR